MKKILIIKGHPREISFCNALVERYIAGAKNNDVEIKTLSLNELKLEPWLKYGWDLNHNSKPDSAEDLKRAEELILWSEHIVFAYPTYWAGLPALLKLFLELIITSGFAFKYHKPIFGKIPHWDQLIKGRTAALISTMDAPPALMHLFEGDPGGKMMRDIMRFNGIKLIAKYYFGSVVLSTPQRREGWLKKAYRIGQKDSR